MLRRLILVAVGLVAAVTGGLVLAMLAPKQADAVTNGIVTVGATIIPAGGTTSVAATFSIDPPAPMNGRPATVSLTVTGGSTGTLPSRAFQRPAR